jgi:hypothetical protein
MGHLTAMTHAVRGPSHDEMAEVTEAHRRAAFESLRMVGWTYEAAQRNDTRRRVIEARAHTLRLREWQATHHRTIRHTPAVDPKTGHWVTRRSPGPWASNDPDLFFDAP